MENLAEQNQLKYENNADRNARLNMTLNDIVNGDEYDVKLSIKAAQIAIDAKNWNKAEKVLLKVDKMFPTTEIKDMLEKVYEAKSKDLQTDEVNKTIPSTSTNVSDDVKNKLLRGGTGISRGGAEKSGSYAIDAISSSKNDQELKNINEFEAEKCILKAQSAIKENDFEKAIRLLRKSVKMYPTLKANELMTQVNEKLKLNEQSVDNNANKDKILDLLLPELPNHSTEDNEMEIMKGETVCSIEKRKQKDIARELLDLANKAINSNNSAIAEQHLRNSLAVYPTEEAQSMLSVFKLFQNKYKETESNYEIAENSNNNGNTILEFLKTVETEKDEIVKTDQNIIELQNDSRISLEGSMQTSSDKLNTRENDKIAPVPLPRSVPVLTYYTKPVLKNDEEIIQHETNNANQDTKNDSINIAPISPNLPNKKPVVPPRRTMDVKNEDNSISVQKLISIFETNNTDEVNEERNILKDQQVNNYSQLSSEDSTQNLENNDSLDNEQDGKILLASFNYDITSNTSTSFTDNLENVYKCIQIAQTALITGDLEKAQRFAVKADRMHSSDVTKDLLKNVHDKCNNTIGNNYSNIHLNNTAKEIEAERLISIAQRELNENRLDEAVQYLLQAQVICSTTKAIQMLTQVQEAMSFNRNGAEKLQSKNELINDQYEINKCIEIAISEYYKGNLKRAERFALKADRMQTTAMTTYLLKMIQEASDETSTSSSYDSFKSFDEDANQKKCNLGTTVKEDVRNNEIDKEQNKITKPETADKLAKEITIAAFIAIANGNLHEAEQYLLYVTQMYFNQEDRDLLDNVQIAIVEKEIGIQGKNSCLQSGILNAEQINTLKNNKAVQSEVTKKTVKRRRFIFSRDIKRSQQKEVVEDTLIRHTRFLQAAKIVYNRGHLSNAKVFLKEADKIRRTDHTKELLEKIKKEKKNRHCIIS